ncbi:MAG TPA: EAL domain-containing protein [Actinomycetota bacterium]|jgi:EAL domain-containing protein (putative c-di-GMP-specific phosphodiesterase class I)/CheY-like chemotaxis protein|nr:EAL domain-containing protein [Actinomycetota bacterium]
MSGIRVMVVDDEDSVVEVLRALIGSDPALRFVGAAKDAERGIKLALEERPDVVLMDVRMPGGGGVRAVREISRRCAPTKVVALSAHEDVDTKIRMIGAGAEAYIPKSESTDEILRAIHRSMDRADPPVTDDLDRRAPADRRDEQRGRVEQALRSEAVTAAFQSIVELSTGQTVGVEAQSRVVMLPSRPFDQWAADAEATGLLREIEVAAFRAAVKALRRIPADRFLDFEVTPGTVRSTAFQQLIGRGTAGRVVLAFSELSPPPDGFENTLVPLRERGVRVCLADVGSELASLDLLVRMRPEFVRIDRALTDDVDRDGSRHAVVAAVVAWADEVGGAAIAEHVSSDGQLRELERLGVRYAQGDHLGPVRHLSELRGRAGRGVKPEAPAVDAPGGGFPPGTTSRE